MARLMVWLCAIVLGISYVQAQNERAASPCKTAKTCGACMQASPDCRWCSQEDFLYDRCDNGITLESLGCGKSSIINEKSSINFTKDENVNDGIGGKPAVQLSPQEIRLKLRPNEPYKLRVTFRQAENYPVDLYYLMDLSASMNDDRDKLAELGVKIAEEMKNITKNFRLGFGSFVDKRAMPYVSTVPKKLQNPCETLTYIKTCDKPYGFKNQMQLGDDPNYFSERVRGAAVSGNLDSPEGGLDALMQALVCKRKIGWRDNSRKLIIFLTDAGSHYAGDGLEKIGWRGYSRKMVLFSTDAPSHFAGDGKLGGIVLPNDGKCHLDSDGLYTHSLLQDYPSISQIARKVSSNNVNVIFAVTSDQTKTYKSLSEFLDGSTVGTLEKDSANIVELVKKNYKDITSKVELKTEGAEDFDVTFQSECLDGKLMDTATCEKLGIGENVTFEVTITAPKCPAGGPQSRQFNIYPVGLSDRLTVKVELVCNCGCENPEITEGDSDKCNGTGKYECGACNCNENRYGQFCQCDAKTVNTKDYDYSCRKTNTSELCEGRGSCVCGKCDCYPISSKNPARKWDGQFCDCDNYNCPYSHGQPCGGPTRGICECSKCKCIGDYFGSNCRCPKSNKKCLTKDGVECNGKGECRCGECVCNKDPFYRGPTCEDCPTCSGKCELNRPCVECKIFREGTVDEESCRANCTHVTGVTELQELDDRRQCQFFDEKNCKFFFTYEYKTNKVEAQETKECPKPVNILAIVLSIIIGIIVIGLALLLIWKLLITINDRREFAKFEKERMNAKWDTGENPIYKQATSTFKNPTYAGKS